MSDLAILSAWHEATRDEQLELEAQAFVLRSKVIERPDCERQREDRREVSRACAKRGIGRPRRAEAVVM
jgi:hypothetical protein